MRYANGGGPVRARPRPRHGVIQRSSPNPPTPGGGPYYQTGDFNAAVSLSAVPEPSSYALLATGFVGLLGVAARRRRTV